MISFSLIMFATVIAVMLKVAIVVGLTKPQTVQPQQIARPTNARANHITRQCRRLELTKKQFMALKEINAVQQLIDMRNDHIQNGHNVALLRPISRALKDVLVRYEIPTTVAKSDITTF